MAIDILREELLSLLGYPIVETAEDGTSSTLEAPVDTFENMDLVGAYVHILSGVGKGQVRAIVSHTDTILTVTPDWDVVPDETSVFAVEKPKRTIIDGVSDVQVTGSTVVIDGTTYQLTDGAVLRGTNAIKPTAALAHAAIPYCYYFAIDTGVVEATDGTNWVVI